MSRIFDGHSYTLFATNCVKITDTKLIFRINNQVKNRKNIEIKP